MLIFKGATEEQDASSAFQWKSLFDAPSNSGRRGGQALSPFLLTSPSSTSSHFLQVSTAHFIVAEMTQTCSSCGRDWKNRQSLAQHRKVCKKYKARLEQACSKDPTGSRPNTGPVPRPNAGWRAQIPRREDLIPEVARASLRHELNEVRTLTRHGQPSKGTGTCAHIPLALLMV